MKRSVGNSVVKQSYYMNMYNMRIHMTFIHEFVKLLGSNIQELRRENNGHVHGTLMRESEKKKKDKKRM
jgi:hypothetical protein